MKKINNYILEKILINKNTKVNNDIDDECKDCCYKLYNLIRNYWDDNKKDIFDELIHGDRKSIVGDLLSTLVLNNQITDNIGDKYYNDIRVLDFCSELAERLKNNKYLNFYSIYQEIAY